MNVYIVTDYIGDKTTEKEIMFEPKFIMGIYSTEDAAMRRKELEERRAEEAGFGDCNKFCVESWVVHESQCLNLSEDNDVFVCSLCNNETHGFMVDDFGMTVGFGKVVSQCPNCGAKVIR